MEIYCDAVMGPPMKRPRGETYQEYSRPLGSGQSDDSGSYLKVRLVSGKPLKNRGWPWVQVCVRSVLGGAERVHKASFLTDGSLLIKTKNRKQTDKFLKATLFGDEECDIVRDSRLNTSKGTIHAFDLIDLPESEIVGWFSDFGVVGAKRITRKEGEDVVNTPVILLTFDKPTCPDELVFDYVVYRVRKHVPNPLMCYKCGRFGHAEVQCKRAAACLICGKEKHEVPCVSVAKCINCSQSGHSCLSRTCPMWKKEKRICEIKVEQDISYAQARREYDRANQIPSVRQFTTVVRTPSEASAQDKTVQKQVENLEKKVDALTSLLGKLYEQLNSGSKGHNSQHVQNEGESQSQAEPGLDSLEAEIDMGLGLSQFSTGEAELDSPRGSVQTTEKQSPPSGSTAPGSGSTHKEPGPHTHGSGHNPSDPKWDVAGNKKGKKGWKKQKEKEKTKDDVVSPSPEIGGRLHRAGEVAAVKQMPSLTRMAFVPEEAM